ncbi:uncharacterized protein METZ01_LOCUS345664, partial [marine metagenome]
TIDAASIRAIKKFAESLKAGAGGLVDCNDDPPEALHLAMQDAIRMQWRSESEERVIIVISDQPPYPIQVDRTLRLSRQFVQQHRGRVSIVHVIQPHTTLSDRRILEQIARAGNGEYIEGGASFIGSVLLAVR